MIKIKTTNIVPRAIASRDFWLCKFVKPVVPERNTATKPWPLATDPEGLLTSIAARVLMPQTYLPLRARAHNQLPGG